MAVKMNKHDLEFVLKQIKIAEAHAAGTPLDQVRVDEAGNYGDSGILAISQPHLPYGLRTVDGTFNNIIPGRELWGAADQTMPRMFDPNWRNDQDGDTMYFWQPGAPLPPGVPAPVTNTDYGPNGQSTGTPSPMDNEANGGHTGNVADADPRIISNLIVDQTPNNPAAIVAALRYGGFEGSGAELNAAVAQIRDPYLLVHAVDQAEDRVAARTTSLERAEARYDAAVAADQAGSSQETQDELAAAEAARDMAAAALGTAQAALTAAEDAADGFGDNGASAALNEAAVQHNIAFEVDGRTLNIPNVAPDEGLSAPFNGWMTFFGQFFDHGLDLISKGGNGTIYVPLQPDDPLYDPQSHTNFMVLTRSTRFDGPGPDGVLGTGDDTDREAINVTTPFVDQNQTYTSHPSHQVFLREYAMVDGKPLATGRMLTNRSANEGGEYFGEGSADLGGLTTWAVVKAQAREVLGIELTDRDVFNIPLIRTDAYGEFIRDANGFAQVIIHVGPDGIPNTEDDVVMSGTAEAPLKLNPNNGGTEPARTSHSFLDDIAHNAVPVLDTQGALRPDGQDLEVDPAGNAVQFDPLTGRNLEYDNELLDRHFITGDGRGNENIGLTAVHHVFHSEHNRQVEVNKLEILKTKDLDFIGEWLRPGGLTEEQQLSLESLDTSDSAALADFASGLSWDGERLFQTARFATEMQYQHLVFEEFGRKIQPLIDPFVFNTITDIDPAIFAEFANVVYRFGHSMLTEDMARMFLNENGEPVRYDENGQQVLVGEDLTDWNQNIGLIEAFLNPIEFDKDGALTHEQAAGAIFRGLNRVHGSEIDEFVVDALRNNLLGLPLDLAAINIARGRDTGMPTLNQAREQLYAASNSTFLKPYNSWTDFASNLKTPASVINFIAAYGTHETILAAGDDLSARRDAATLLVLGDGAGADGALVDDASTDGDETADNVAAPDDRLAWLNGPAAETGVNDIDLWIGGLAEKIMPFGGMLGSTFNAVFEAQMEMLQDLDRFYYLTRTQGLNLLNELENNAFSKMIMVNTDMTDPGPDGIRGTEDDIVNYHVGVDSFAKHDFVLEVDKSKQIGEDPTHDDPTMEGLGLTKVMRDDPTTAAVEENYLRFIGGEHTVIGGTDYEEDENGNVINTGVDTIIGDYGDDAIWGGSGNDRIEAGAGVDLVVGGAGDDIITDSGDTGDFLKGEEGDDVIANSNGLDVLMGGDGQDVFLVGVDGTEVFGGEGVDFILGGADADFLRGGEGDDWMEGGGGFDVLNGENSELFFNSTIIGHDVLFAGDEENDFDAESGDDIMVQGESVMRNEGMLGFDWAIHKGNRIAADSDMRIPIFTNVADDILRDRFDQTEALSGWKFNDVLRGDDRGSTEEIEVELDMTGHELTQAGVDRIDGLRELLGLAVRGDAADDDIAWTGGNLLIGGEGHDTFQGRGGDDFIHGDAWLNVRISVKALAEDDTVTDIEAFTVDSLAQVVTIGDETKPLSEFLLDGTVKPRQMQIVREIKYDENVNDDVDTAIFSGNMDWYEITQLDGDIVKIARREQEEIDPQIDEGTDTLVGIERIMFADQIFTIRETGNVNPTGRLTLGPLPATEDQALTVSAEDIRDENNPGGTVDNIVYRWQIERNDGTGDYIDIPGAVGTSFTPSDEHTGLRIRVLGTYVDAGGVMEIVSSAPTDLVIGINDEPVGVPLISDMTPTEGETLTATAAFTDPDGMSDAFEEFLLSYQWQYSTDGETDWQDVPAEEGGNLRTFTPGEDHVSQYLRVVVTYTDDLGAEHTVESAVTAMVGNHIDSNEAVIDVNDGVNEGDNFIQAGDANNTITGLGGNDVIHGGAGGDTLNGGAGDDTLDGGAGNDAVNGGAGDDTIVYGSLDDNDSIDGGENGDGSADLDTLRIVESVNGASDSITVDIEGGIVTGVNGSSVVNVENVELNLGAGEDTLRFDALDGVTVDLLTGTATGFAYIRGVENVTGDAGNDAISGNNAVNILDGAGGDDTLRGGFGNDLLSGSTGNDRLYGDEDDDTLVGGEGDDRVDGGSGTDTASYVGAAAAVTVALGSFEPQDTVGAGMDSLISIENLTGSSHGDTLTGDGAANVIDGGAGADAMTGGAGNDTYVVDDAGDVVTEVLDGGEDTVRSTLGAYTLTSNVENLVLDEGAGDGTGNELANTLTGNSGDNTLDGGLGDDTVVLTGTITDQDFALVGGEVTVTSADGGTDTLLNIENAEISGVSYNIVPGTNAADDPATGTEEADLVLGFDGTDALEGGGGNDILVGGNQRDTMEGGAGDDTYIVNNGGDSVDEASGDGIDTILSTVGRNLNNDNHASGDVENLTLLGENNINAVGNALDNVLTGNSGDNILSGVGGSDTLLGNAGNDDLRGGGANDTLEGGAGDDALNGQGGAGDTAVFTGPAGNYSFGFDVDGLASVTDMVIDDGDEGTDTLANIERLQFGDGESLAILNGAGDITADEGSIIFGSDGDDTITGSDADDVIVGGAGDDTLNGNDVPEGDNATEGALDDDTFIWRVGDGTDAIHGGFEGTEGDKFQIVGNDEEETYRIYTYDEAVARIGFAGNEEAEIVVTRAVADVDGNEVETIIADLTEIEEITVNGAGVSGNGTSGGDAYEIYGNFDTTTNLRPNTITIIGSEGNDTVDITGLQSAHRIVFKTNGGDDTVIGTLRPQDVVELEDGMTFDDYAVTENEDGSTTYSSDTSSVTFHNADGPSDPTGEPGEDPDEGSVDNPDDGNVDDPDDGTDGSGNTDPDDVPGTDDPDDDGSDEDDTDGPGEDNTDGSDEDDGEDDQSDDDDDSDDDSDDSDDDDEDEEDDSSDDDDDDDDAQAGSGDEADAAGSVVAGTAAAEVLVGTEGDDTMVGLGGGDGFVGDAGDDTIHAGNDEDFVSGGAGRDVVMGNGGDDEIFGGDDSDMLFGGDGEDLIFGEEGDDVVEAGDDEDTVFAGSGDDTIVAKEADGADSYYGEGGEDTLDYAAITENLTVDLGNGAGNSGRVTTESGESDVTYGFENVVGGSGDDTITASGAENVMDGGEGDDTFAFQSAAAADGDTIVNFQQGDKIDLSQIDGDTGTAGKQGFSLQTGTSFTAAGQVRVNHETRDDGEYTVVSGNVNDDEEADFELNLTGRHELTNSDFTGLS